MVSSNKQLDAQLKSIKTNTTRIEIEIVKYKNNKINAEHLEQEFTKMCERLDANVDRFEKEYKFDPDSILELMNEANNAIANTQLAIDVAIGQ